MWLGEKEAAFVHEKLKQQLLNGRPWILAWCLRLPPQLQLHPRWDLSGSEHALLNLLTRQIITCSCLGS